MRTSAVARASPASEACVLSGAVPPGFVIEVEGAALIAGIKLRFGGVAAIDPIGLLGRAGIARAGAAAGRLFGAAHACPVGGPLSVGALGQAVVPVLPRLPIAPAIGIRL